MTEHLNAPHWNDSDDAVDGSSPHMQQKACFQANRVRLASAAELAMGLTGDFRHITKESIGAFPEILSVLRMACTPPLSIPALAAHTHLPAAWLEALENDQLPHDEVMEHLPDLEYTAQALTHNLDPVAFPWLEADRRASPRELLVATFFVADRMCCAQYEKEKKA